MNIRGMLKVIFSFLLLTLILLLVSCELDPGSASSGNSNVRFAILAAATEMDMYELKVSGSGMDTIQDTYAGDTTRIVITVPSGDARQFELLAIVASPEPRAVSIYRGVATADLLPGATVNITISLEGHEFAKVPLDAFVANSPGANIVWWNNRSGTFTVSPQSLGSSNSAGIVLGDVDDDGDLDAFVANSPGVNKVWLNDGSGLFTDSSQSLGSSNSAGVALGDLDDDGDLDAFVANNNEANVVWLNDGSGTFTDSLQTLGSSKSAGIALGDLDDDGDLDAVSWQIIMKPT